MTQACNAHNTQANTQLSITVTSTRSVHQSATHRNLCSLARQSSSPTETSLVVLSPDCSAAPKYQHILEPTRQQLFICNDPTLLPRCHKLHLACTP